MANAMLEDDIASVTKSTPLPDKSNVPSELADKTSESLAVVPDYEMASLESSAPPAADKNSRVYHYGPSKISYMHQIFYLFHPNTGTTQPVCRTRHLTPA